MVLLDNSYIQEQHFRINNALAKFEPGSTAAMWAILQGLYTIDSKKIDLSKNIPNTQISTKNIDYANECEYYIAFTQKTAALIGNNILTKAQMYSLISMVKSELYKAYSKYVSENYTNSGINFITPGTFIGGK